MPVASPNVELHRFALCQYSEAVALALACCEVEATTALYDATTLERARSLSPTGQLPVVVWDDKVLSESRDIIRFLSEQCPECELCEGPQPVSDAILAKLAVLVEMMVAEDEQSRIAFAQAFNNGQTSDELEQLVVAHSQKNARATGLADMSRSERMAALLEILQTIGAQISKRPWLGSSRPHMADCFAGASLRTLARVSTLNEHTVHLGSLLHREPEIIGWMERLEGLIEGQSPPHT